MKVCFLPHLCLGLILASTATASILTEAKIPEPARSLPDTKPDLKTEIAGIIKNRITEKKTALTINYLQESCGVYNPKDDGSRFSVCVQTYDPATNTISLQFRSPNNHFELEFSNINLSDIANDIKIEPYVDEYLDSLKELAVTPAARFAAIKDGLDQAATELNIGPLNIPEPSSDLKEGVEFVTKIAYTYQSKANDITLKLKGDLLEFSTDFFQDTIDLNIPLKRFIVFEVKKMAREIIEHLYQMQRFALSDGESAAQSIKTLSCAQIMGGEQFKASFEERMKKNGLEVAFETGTPSGDQQASSSGASLTITKDIKNVKVTCAPITVGDFNLLEVKADFGGTSTSIQPITQAYLEKSLYNLEPVSVAFFHDLGTFVIRLLADHNSEEEFEPVSVETSTPQ